MSKAALGVLVVLWYVAEWQLALRFPDLLTATGLVALLLAALILWLAPANSTRLVTPAIVLFAVALLSTALGVGVWLFGV